MDTTWHSPKRRFMPESVLNFQHRGWETESVVWQERRRHYHSVPIWSVLQKVHLSLRCLQGNACSSIISLSWNNFFVQPLYAQMKVGCVLSWNPWFWPHRFKNMPDCFLGLASKISATEIHGYTALCFLAESACPMLEFTCFLIIKFPSERQLIWRVPQNTGVLASAPPHKVSPL